MFAEYWTQYRKLILIIGGSLALVLIGWLVYFNIFVFHVTNISPEPNRASFLSPRLVVDFNKELSGDNFVVESVSLDVSGAVEGKKLVISIAETMTVGEVYTIKIVRVTSTSGDEIKDYVISLRANPGDESLTEKDSKILLDRQQNNKSKILNDPIFSYLPHSTLNYRIDSKINNADTEFEKITIRISLQLSAADVRINKNAAIEQYRKEATDYLSSLKDVDLSKYTVEVTVIDPTL